MEVLKQYKRLEIGLAKLKEVLGNDLYNVENICAEKIRTSDVVYLIKQFLANALTTEELLEWVNTVWFTDLYEYAPNEENAIASVIALLETLDEDAEFSSGEYEKMISCLEQNKECEL